MAGKSDFGGLGLLVLLAVGGYVLLNDKDGRIAAIVGGGKTSDIPAGPVGNQPTPVVPAPEQTPAQAHDRHYVIDAARKTIWRVESGRKRRFGDWWSYLEDGGERDLSNVYPIADGDLARIPDGPVMPTRRPSWMSDNTFVLAHDNNPPIIFLMQAGKKRPIPDFDTFVSLSGTRDWARVVTRVLGGDLQSVPDGAPMSAVQRVPSGTITTQTPQQVVGGAYALARYVGDGGKLWAIVSGQKRRVPDAATWTWLGARADYGNVVWVNSEQPEYSYPEGAPISSVR